MPEHVLTMIVSSGEEGLVVDFDTELSERETRRLVELALASLAPVDRAEEFGSFGRDRRR